ncbi:MAG: aminotransferase class V-fold PLP-dependent enzyme [Oligoflexia bacterium]|nr:aminotransferase class V-fold PLP-dependent enzyme [Oligoflexia bacterium]
MSSKSHLPYDPERLPRELKKYYICASEKEISEMLSTVGAKNRDDLFSHISDDVKFLETPEVTTRLEYDDLIDHMEELAAKNTPKLSFIGDGLPHYKVPETTAYVSNLRGLTTAYTPYQPERSQGTLQTLWLYSSSISMLTGMEAINASFYDRSTCLFEALNTSVRLTKTKKKVLISEGLYAGDIEVIQTLAKETELEIITLPIDSATGKTDIAKLKEAIANGDISGFAFGQVNQMGILEDVNHIVDTCKEAGVKTIALFDPMHIATGGLVQPSKMGSDQSGVDMIVGEGQHLAIAPNFGGPGLGIFGIRYNDSDKISIRSTAGRYVGKAKDSEGKDCLAMILSTREQHIRREKATSNICSNQSFLATLAGAGVLSRGETGMTKAIQTARQNAVNAFEELTQFEGVNYPFSNNAFYNEFVLELSKDVDELIESARTQGIHLGVNLKERDAQNRNLLKLSFSDIQTTEDLEKLSSFFASHFEKGQGTKAPELASELLRKDKAGLPDLCNQELKAFYLKLSNQNVSPDDNIYPLGSCTMKYNPYINDYAAGLQGFTDIHPQAPLEDAQGCLEILFETQEMFKKITGLPGLTTEPVAGAQGELVGLKLFQAYHRDRGNAEKKDIIIIPKSAHGTNPATATMAGYISKRTKDGQTGIITIDANENGQIDFTQLQDVVAKYGERIAGIMVTNPNTSGIFENQFKEMADLIHSVDGLVYMDGANMNAIASWVNLDKLGVDAVHNNLHKTWTIPHGGGGPGDAIVAVSDKLLDYLPGIQVRKNGEKFETFRAPKTIGSFHRHYGNFAHKVRCYTYLKALGSEGIREMSAIAVLSARYLFEKLKDVYPTLPAKSEGAPRMHEFIITLSKESFDHIQNNGTPKAQAIAKIGKLFLDFGLHAPTVAFPEQFGLMIEPTESFTKKELDDFLEVLMAIKKTLNEKPEVLQTVPHFTPISKVDEVGANKNIQLWENLQTLPKVLPNKIEPGILKEMSTKDILEHIGDAHAQRL